MNNIYYVYHHIRLDENKIFYVGKGKKNRHLETSNRNKYWRNVVNKAGFHSEILFENLDEELAFLVESELIDKYKKIGLNLVNLTKGGEGPSGYKHTSKTKKLISETSKGRKHSEESKIKIGLGWKGKKRKPFSEEHKLKLSEASKLQKRSPTSQETKNKISKANFGKKRTIEQRIKISEATKKAIAGKLN